MRKVPFIAIALLLGFGIFQLNKSNDYTLQLLMPSAQDVFVGATITIAGQGVGEVKDVDVKDGQARVTVSVDKAHSPLRAGTTGHVTWNSAIGRRAIELVPGPNDNAALPSGKLVVVKTERVELDEVLAALDTPTRAKVQSLVGNLQTTLKDREPDANATITEAGPAVQALGDVLKGVGEDGPAIRALVTNLHDVTSTLSKRHSELADTIQNLGAVVSSAAAQQKQLKAALDEAPSTITQGTNTFAKVPDAVDNTVPLLKALHPATKQLPEVASNLNPVLTDLKPSIAALRPTLQSVTTLLQYMPGLLANAHSVIPQVSDTVTSVGPAVSFLRPYTPETIGFLSNWTSIFAAKNDTGHHARALLVESATSVTDLPIIPPGTQLDTTPAPGSLAGQPWTDANGDAIR